MNALTIVPTRGPLRLHGDLDRASAVAHWGGRALARDVADDPAARCALLGLERAVLCIEGAAWALAAIPGDHEVPVVEHTPLPGRRNKHVRRQMRLRPVDVTTCGGAWVTTPRRTLADCLRHLPPERAEHWALALLRAHPELAQLPEV